MGHIKFYYRKLKADLYEFERSKGKGKEKFENATMVVQEFWSYQTELLMVEDEKSTYSDC